MTEKNQEFEEKMKQLTDTFNKKVSEIGNAKEMV
jgi:cell division protein ZapA (FtsZ GTPase activity inhibitor)